MFPPAGDGPQRLQYSSRSGHENDPDSLHSAGPGVPETGSVHTCLFCVLHIYIRPQISIQVKRMFYINATSVENS